MEAHISELYELLENERTVHEQLCELARAMNGALKANKAAEVQTISARYDELVCRLEQLEENRVVICDAVAKTLNAGSRHLTLPKVIEALPEERRGAFVELRARLRERMRELARINTSNQVLLNEALTDISRTVEMLAVSRNTFTPYQRGKKQQEAARRPLFNRVA